MKNTIQTADKFLDKVNKLAFGRKTHDEVYGTVTCIIPATPNKSNKTGYGTRRFSVKNSIAIHPGSYTLSGLRNAVKQ